MSPDRRAFAFLLVLPLVYLLGCGGGGAPTPSPEGGPSVAVPEGDEAERTLLYPSAEDGLLHAEKVRMAAGATPEESMALLVSRYIQGPAGEGRFSPFPEHCTLRALYLVSGARAVVDLGGPVTSGGGVHTEVHRIYGIVNTLVWNFPEIRSVQVLIEGRETDTLLGHLDLSKPICPENRLLGLELRRSEGLGGVAGE
ncbi:MAG: GerMN domain-containing protein [Acidobacteriota bacterium]